MLRSWYVMVLRLFFLKLFSDVVPKTAGQFYTRTIGLAIAVCRVNWIFLSY